MSEGGGNQLVRRLGPAGALGIAWILLPIAGLALLGSNLGAVTRFLTADRAQGLAIYVAAFAALAGLGLMPTWAQSLIGGWAFGLTAGGPAALLAITIASWIGYEVARGASSDRVEKVIAERPTWRAVRDDLIGAGFLRSLGMVTLVRLPPNSPFAITNLVLASAGVRRGVYLLGTVLGITPRTILTVFLGSQIHDLTAESLKTPKWVVMLSIGLTVAVIVVIGAVAKRAVERVARSASAPPGEETTSASGGVEG
jgi:uncharacterized membrane protein YdjX (TVP38/TMEM64 family)